MRAHPALPIPASWPPPAAMVLANDPDDDRIAAYDYAVPEGRIAQAPVEPRDEARLMVLDRTRGGVAHHRVRDLPDLLTAGDVVVVNDTRVIPARVAVVRPGGGAGEVLLLRSDDPSRRRWEALVRPSGRLAAGVVVRTRHAATGIRMGERAGDGTRWVELLTDGDLDALLEDAGTLPLPPYLIRPGGPTPEDRGQYQTVFAAVSGAVAAPTAGLHFTPALLESLAAAGVEQVSLTLHVGAGTFQPVRAERLADHPMHTEDWRMPAPGALRLRAARGAGRRIVAIGTTSCRAVEAWAEEGMPLDGVWRRTRICLSPARPPRAVVSLLTNFHQPRTTLLPLVASFIGRRRLLDAYRTALAEDYRLFSYGDAMLVL